MKLTFEILVLVLGASVMLRVLPRSARPRNAVRHPASIGRPEDLQRVERLVWARGSNAADVHLRLRPLLREIAIARLEGHGIALDRDPDEARLLLGDELWEIVRPERPRPEDPRGPGIPLDRLTAITDRLERL